MSSLVLAACRHDAVTRQSPVLDRTAIAASCGSANPFLATALQQNSDHSASGDAAVVAFNDRSDSSTASQIVLATRRQVGSVYGLAYDAPRRRLLAGAYHKRMTVYGPGGPGQIYAIDPNSGVVTAFAKLQAGTDGHDSRLREDAAAAPGVGITGLGELEIAADRDELLVANLSDARIYRLSLADGRVLGSFRHGAAAEAWAKDARPFALAYSQGWLYHTVVNSQASAAAPGPPTVSIYQSKTDGSQMSLVATAPLDYGRPAAWSRWDTPVLPPQGRVPQAQPMATELQALPDGRWLIGLRDRVVDMLANLSAVSGSGFGDLVALQQAGGTWQLQAPEPFADAFSVDESFYGAAGRLPGLDVWVAPAFGPLSANSLGAVWIDLPGGATVRRVTLAEGYFLGAAPAPGRQDAVLGLGSVAALCPPIDAGSTDGAATATAIVALATQEAIGTATAASNQATAAARATADARATRQAEAPDLIAASCGSDDPTFVIPRFSRGFTAEQMAGEAAIVAFTNTVTEDPRDHFVLATQGEVGTVFGLAYDVRRGHLYAGAYHKRGTLFGPRGPGQVYRLDMRRHTVEPFASLDAGPDVHNVSLGFDQDAADYVGKTSLGDVEISDDGSRLFVMNLFDRRIYAYGVPGGEPLGAFPHGAADEPWAESARPFALGVHGGKLYHGVVNSMESGTGGPLEAYVYRTDFDGANKVTVAKVDLTYGRTPSWVPWVPVNIFDSNTNTQPMLTDIEFRPNGTLLLGLRDRVAEMNVYVGFGDLLPTEKFGSQFRAITRPEFYADDWAHIESLWGTLAAFPGRDWVVSSALAPNVINSGGAAWYDNDTGQVQRRETIYSIADPFSFLKSQGLGDIEALCPPPGVPTLAPTPTPETTETPIPSDTPPTLTPTVGLTPPTSTAVPSAIPSPTATSIPRPIYLPLIADERCVQVHVDVTLVLDMSTSMARTTRSGRTKYEAAIAAGLQLVALLDLTPDGEGASDQAAVVGFNRDAWTAQSLTNNAAALRRALDGLPAGMREYTRLDLAVREGAGAALGRGHRPDNVPVVVLLTDGLPNQVPLAEDGSMATTILREADAAKAKDVRFFTVGVGAPEDIDGELLMSIASRPNDYRYAPDAEDLASIYAELGGRLRCVGGLVGGEDP